MSIECYFCERDLRGPHDKDCPRYKPPMKCNTCGDNREPDEEGCCETCGCIKQLSSK